MPHFTIEYSANLDARLDMADVVDVVRKAAVETGIFPLGSTARIRCGTALQTTPCAFAALRKFRRPACPVARSPQPTGYY